MHHPPQQENEAIVDNETNGEWRSHMAAKSKLERKRWNHLWLRKWWWPDEPYIATVGSECNETNYMTNNWFSCMESSDISSFEVTDGVW